MSEPTSQAVIVHLIYRLDVGGLEKVMLDCIIGTQQDFRHIVICLKDASEFARQLPTNVEVIELHKPEGNSFKIYLAFWRLLRSIKPDVLHSYNIATLEFQPFAWLARVKGRIHAEHGRDISDPQGKNTKYKLLRKLISPFVDKFVAVSDDLYQWLNQDVGLKKTKTQLIYNGVNVEKFVPRQLSAPSEKVVFGTVARLAPIKNHKFMLNAVHALLKNHPQSAGTFELRIIGDGPLRQNLLNQIDYLQLAQHVFLLGEKHDIAEQLQQMNVFVLSSQAEGIPISVLEAQATGLAIIATRVGGLPELIRSESQGLLVESENVQQLAAAMARMLASPEEIIRQGAKNREFIKRSFSTPIMVNAYRTLYQKAASL
ncbi:MAG: sugar transferase (PEP-CTERM/EpsH1 system associated) [Paraglaciecola sp.]|jgi:sugar transferase (PEP-CTERM/EpsH1 system associated)